VTRSGLGLALVGVLAAGAGLAARWPELLIFGAALLGAVVLTGFCAAVVRTTPVTLRAGSVEVHRFEPAAVPVDLEAGRSRGLRVEVASDPEPRVHHSTERYGSGRSATLAFATDRRQVQRHGPVRAIWVDPLGIWRRVVGTGEDVEVVVTPRRGSVDDELRAWNPGDEWESPRALRRSHLSELLTEYVAGDEPRRIHWRSSARMGRLMVRQRLGTESRDTLVYLDCDPNAWRSATGFDDNDSAEQFELGVELATAVVHQLAALGAHMAFLTEADEHPYFVDRVSEARFGRRMAEVALQQVAAISHTTLSRALRAHRFRRIIVVTFQPTSSLQAVLAERGRLATIRLITPMPPPSTPNERFPVESVQWIPSAG